jgi:hypothetical protein
MQKMKNESSKIIFDFSPYFGNEVKFEEYYCLKDSISSIIKNTNHLNEEMKVEFLFDPPQYKINGRIITEEISFEDIGIENGNIISVYKIKKKKRFYSIKTTNENELISKECFIASNHMNTITTFKNEETIKKSETQIIQSKSKCVCISIVFILIALFVIIGIVLRVAFLPILKKKE